MKINNMIKVLSFTFILFVFELNAQQSIFVINNYTTYDMHSAFGATSPSSCYPYVNVLNPDPIIVPANANQSNGTQLQYNSFFSSGGIGNLYPIFEYTVKTSVANPVVIRPYNHISLSPTGVIASNVDWAWCKFQMYFAGTNTPESYFNGNIGNNTFACFASLPSYISTPHGDADFFTISSGSTKFTFLQFY